MRLTVVNRKSVLLAMYPEYADVTCPVCSGTIRSERALTGMHNQAAGGELMCAISVVMPVR